MEWAPISVVEDLLATENDHWNSWLRVAARAPALEATRTASFILAQIQALRRHHRAPCHWRTETQAESRRGRAGGKRCPLRASALTSPWRASHRKVCGIRFSAP
jgi:hypothetical protein